MFFLVEKERSVGNPVLSLGVVIDFEMAGIVLVPVSQDGEDQLLWPRAQ